MIIGKHELVNHMIKTAKIRTEELGKIDDFSSVPPVSLTKRSMIKQIRNDTGNKLIATVNCPSVYDAVDATGPEPCNISINTAANNEPT